MDFEVFSYSGIQSEELEEDGEKERKMDGYVAKNRHNGTIWGKID